VAEAGRKPQGAPNRSSQDCTEFWSGTPGVGLALVRVIVTRHGGQVAIRSRDGPGAVVSIRLLVPGRAGTAPDVADLRHRRDPSGKVTA
jgi:signal transduction histidine kinase